MLAEYLRKIADSTSQGDACEESYYSHLSFFVRSFAGGTDQRKSQSLTCLRKLTQTIEIQKTLTASFFKVEAAVII